jgi:hypothetical protein
MLINENKKRASFSNTKVQIHTLVHMTTIIITSVLSVVVVVVVVVSLLLIAGCFENAARIQQAIAGNSNALQPTTTTTTTTTANNNNNNNHNGGALSVGPPEKITILGQTEPPILSPEKKQALQQDQAKTYRSPELPISDQTIQGPTPGTQTQ